MPNFLFWRTRETPRRAPSTLVTGKWRSEMRREDCPSFKRTYVTTLAGGVTVEIDRRTNMFGERGGYLDSGRLRQPDGRSMYFNIHRIADHILDIDLLEPVQRAVKEALELDRAFMAGATTFTDYKGQQWAKVTTA